MSGLRNCPYRSFQIVQVVALGAERGRAGDLGGTDQAVGDGAGVRAVEIDRGGYFRCFSRPPVDGVDFPREMPVFLSSTVFPVDGSFFGKSVVITRRWTGGRQNI